MTICRNLTKQSTGDGVGDLRLEQGPESPPAAHSGPFHANGGQLDARSAALRDLLAQAYRSQVDFTSLLNQGPGALEDTGRTVEQVLRDVVGQVERDEELDATRHSGASRDSEDEGAATPEDGAPSVQADPQVRFVLLFF